MPDRRQMLMDWRQAMLDALGPSRWWPGETPFEVAVGAILTQNTSWANVEKAIHALRSSGLLEAEALYALPEPALAELIRPAGCYRLKANRLRHFLQFLRDSCSFDITALGKQDRDGLRRALLEIKGIGPETGRQHPAVRAGHAELRGGCVHAAHRLPARPAARGRGL